MSHFVNEKNYLFEKNDHSIFIHKFARKVNLLIDI